MRGVHDTHVHTGLAGVVQEGAVERAAHGLVAAEGEGQVGHASADFATRAETLDLASSVDEVNAVVVVFFHARADRKNVRVKDDVLRVEAKLFDQELVSAAANAHLLSFSRRLPFLVERHHDDGGAVTLHDLRVMQELFLTTLEGDRVHDALALAALQASLDDVELGRVNHERNLGGVRLGNEQVHKARHGSFAVDQAVVHVDVNDVRTVLDLLERDGESLLKVTIDDGLLEDGRARNVAPFTEVDERLAVVIFVRHIVERLETGDAHNFWHIVLLARRVRCHHLGESADVVIRGAAAATDAIQQPLLEEDAAVFGHFSTLLIVTTHGVRQTGVRVREHPAVGALAQVLNVRDHVLGAESAVQANSHRLGVADGVPERLVRLARQGTTGVVDDGAGDEQRKTRTVSLKELLNGENRRLGVERVKDRFNQNQVHTTLDECLNLLVVRVNNLVERTRAERRVLDGWRHRECSVRRTNGAGGKARLGRILLRKLHARRLRQASSGQVHVAHFFLLVELVVRLRDHRRRERVRLDDVGARGEIRLVDFRDDLRLRQHQDVVVPLQVMRMILVTITTEVILAQLVLLHRRSHRAVDHHHALLHDTLDDVERRRLLQRIHPLRVLRHLRSVCLRFHLRVQVVVPRRVPEPLHLVLLHRLRPAQFQGERGDDADRRQDRRQHDEQRGEQRGYGPGR